MAYIIRLRARRFDALQWLLTGAAHPELPAFKDGSDHLPKDLGLPEKPLCSPTATAFGPLTTDPRKRRPTGRSAL